jgi:hypothetical protein
MTPIASEECKPIKKIVSVFLILMVFFSGLLVINLNLTKEQARISQLETTPTSFKIYVTNTTQTPAEMLQFFETLKNQQQVSIVRSDVTDKGVVKSAIVAPASFPYANFFQTNQRFSVFPKATQFYSNTAQKSADPKPILTFGNQSVVVLQSMVKYYRDDAKSANGVYTIIPAKSADAEKLKPILAAFFGIPQKILTTPETATTQGYVNEYVLAYLVVIGILALLTLLSIVAIPMTQVKTIGIWKLNGFTNMTILQRLFLLPVIVTLVSAVILDITVHFYFNYLPTQFLQMLFLSQLGVLLILGLAILIATGIIFSITIGRMLKQALNFKVGIGLMLVLKVLMTIVTTVLIIAGMANVRESQKADATYQRIASEGNYLAVNRIGYTTDETFKNVELNNGKNEAVVAQLFQKLEAQTKAQFVRGEIVKPAVNFQSHTQTKAFQMLNPGESFQVVKANANYLKHVHMNSIKPSTGNTLLVPIALKSQGEKIMGLGKLLAHSDLSYEAQQQQSVDGMRVKIRYYNDKNIQTRVFIDNEVRTFHNPIFLVISSKQSDHYSMTTLTDTSTAGPMRIPNTKHNRQVLKRLTSPAELPGIRLRFATVGSMVNDQGDAYRMGFQLTLMLLGIIFAISLIVTGFTSVLYFTTNRLRLSILRIMGIKLVDRYRNILIILVGAYLIQIGVAVAVGRSLIALGIGLALMVVDILLILLIFIFQENRNLVQVLKGE